jgi:diguanylate cyclase (GGDEF)-like protein
VGERILLLEDRLVEARENTRFRATHDQLTSLLNRGAVMGLLVRELHRSHREQKSTAILLGDVDHFKQARERHIGSCRG